MTQERYTVASLAVAGMLWFSGPAMAQKGVNADTPSGAVITGQNESRIDTRFAREAAQGGMFEVQAGQVAVQKAADNRIKQFGQRMIDDHTKLNDQLKAVAAKDNITLPEGLDAKDQATMNRFSQISGPEFDRVYGRDMVRDHEHDIAAFQREANGGTNPDLRNFAQMALPILQEHLRLAKDNEQALGVTSRK